jgi:hypothetical protein
MLLGIRRRAMRMLTVFFFHSSGSSPKIVVNTIASSEIVDKGMAALSTGLVV